MATLTRGVANVGLADWPGDNGECQGCIDGGSYETRAGGLCRIRAKALVEATSERA